MTRRSLWFALLLSVLAMPRVAEAQPPGKVWRIGGLGVTSRSGGSHLYEAARQGFGELGYLEGKNFVLDMRWADGKLERLPDLVAELIGLGADVIVTTCGAGLRAVRRASATIPVVIAACADPAGFVGEVASLARPGGNTTGLTLLTRT